MHKFRLLLLGLAVIAQSAHAGEDWSGQADRIMSTIPAAGPGASVLIAQDGRTLYSSARGMASVELGTPLAPDSVFRIGSLTKTVTAATVLRLSELGRLDLDAPVSKVLPDFAYASRITARQLLSHTSGVSDAWNAPLTDVLDTPKRLRLIGDTPLDFAPGTDWRYSNSGYMVLGAMVERITGQPWQDAEKQLVLAPAGATSMSYYDDAAVVPRLVSGYTVDDAGALARPAPYSITGPGAAGGLVSDALGVALLLHAIGTHAASGASEFALMSTPTRIGTTEVPYGLGMVPGSLQGERIVEHSGGIEGYLAHYVYVPARDMAVVVLENSDAPAVPARSLARRLTALAIGKPYRVFAQADWPPDRLTALAGSYVIQGAGLHTIEIRQGTAWIRRDDGPAKRLQTAVDDTLIYAGDGIDYLRAVRDARGRVTALDFHVDGADAGRREPRVPSKAP